ncbi:MAG: FemAB family PEP-CTERM system-associated protein [Phycisphaerae bacterium]|nr:FemAB family PEP-CTERM system-associated protein [Phycisphaerae bacterium]
MSEGLVRIQLFEASQSAHWQAYAESHPEGTLFHGLAWKRAVERAFGHRPRYIVARRGKHVVGVFPLFEVHSVLAGRLLVSVPYATYGGILADDEEVASALFDNATVIARQGGVRSIELRSIRASVPGLTVSRSHATFRKPLPPRGEDVLAGMPRKARAAARRAAERYELSVAFDRGLLPIVWRLYSRSMRRLGSPNYPYRFFEELVAATGTANVVHLVRCQGRPVAGLLTFLHRDTVMPYFAGIDERESIYGLNNFLYAESMRWGAEHGFAQYDFGRTRIGNTGSYNFKRFCGFEPRPLEFQTHVMPGRAAPDLSAGSPRWAAARRVWKTLPLPITRPLGAWLAKSIPG